MASRPHPARPVNLPLFPGMESHRHDPGTVTGTVKEVLHAGLDTGFSIVRVESPDHPHPIVVCGKGDALNPGDEISAEGIWNIHPKWGRQFEARFIRAGVPESAAGIARYIGAGHIAGVGARTGEKLLEFFGDRLPEVMSTPTTLMAAGIPEDKARRICDHWQLRTRHARVLSLLMAHRIGLSLAQRIIAQFGDQALRIATQTPYRLREVRGIGFKKADAVALSQNLPKNAPERIRAAIEYQLEQISREGHCAASRSVLIAEVSKLLLQPDALIESQIEAMLIQGDLVEEKIGGRPVIYLKAMRDCEVQVAEQIAGRLGSAPLPSDIEQRIDDAVARLNLPPLHVNQREAVRTAIANSVSVITGNPGTGKTSTVSVMLRTLQDLVPGLRICLAAPTGRAAKRLTESTGFEASTLHRLLEWSPEKRGFTRNAENELDCDVLVIDESSMLDIWLMRDVLNALPRDARLVVVGDVDQLPSVGPGNVLADIISSATVPVVRLTHIFRQGAGSSIATAAQQINAGVMPRLPAPHPDRDMWGIFVRETKKDDKAGASELVGQLKHLVGEVIPKMGFDPLRDLQVLTPGHQNETGTVRLNLALQELMNPLRPGMNQIVHKDRSFRVNDRVIQVANNYDLDVFNGDIGIVTALDHDEDALSLTVDFDGREVVYERSALDELQHAYAITIHKSQGSEFPAVIVVVTTQHYMMLKRNLTYTGVSRARKLCCVLGQPRALQISVRSGGTARTTGLAQRLAAKAAANDVLASIGLAPEGRPAPAIEPTPNPETENPASSSAPSAEDWEEVEAALRDDDLLREDGEGTDDDAHVD